MTLLTWNHACTVGIRAMDNQHGILMDAINDLRMALLRGSGPQKIGELLNELIEFTRMHFASEEQLMEQTAFPGLDSHRAEHQRILVQLRHGGHQLQYVESTALRHLLCSLHDGFLQHIECEDQQYAPWLREHGIL